MMKNLWRAFKMLLSALMLSVAGLLAVAYFAKGDLGIWFVILLLILFSAIIWVDYSKIKVSPVILLSLLGVGSLCLSYTTFSSKTQFPHSCTGGRTLICNFENLLFTLGGRPAAAIPWLLVGVLIFRGAYFAYKKSPSNPNRFLGK